jgi:hypothetical protein
MATTTRSNTSRHTRRAKGLYLGRELAELEQFAIDLGFDEVAMFIGIAMLSVEDHVEKGDKACPKLKPR